MVNPQLNRRKLALVAEPTSDESTTWIAGEGAAQRTPTAPPKNTLGAVPADGPFYRIRNVSSPTSYLIDSRGSVRRAPTMPAVRD
jgi:hypothetical protein